MNLATIESGHKVAVVSKWVQSDGSVRFVVKGKNGGSTKLFKTESGAMKAAHTYVGK